ncbi:MAG: hypothetical protein ACK5UE_00695 [Chitinophagales bacterium]|jgi:uncharacterized protein (TIGR02646 family)|nr:hypothetical protein [Sphingobacteriales bacterium]
MEKITRPNLDTIAELIELKDNWVAWGQEFKSKLEAGGKSSDFSWKRNINNPLVSILTKLTYNHCNFCDSYLGESSTYQLEHYYPKNEFPLLSYNWSNLFLCCNFCNSSANKQRRFIDNLKPDHPDYSFDSIFYFDAYTGKIEIIETLEIQNSNLFLKANNYLIRYGINNEDNEKNKRCFLRKMEFQNIRNHFKNKKDDDRERDDFKFRFIYDCVGNSELI